MDYFGLQTRAYVKGGEEEEDRGRSSQGMEPCIDLYGYMNFAWILVWFLYTNYLGMDC